MTATNAHLEVHQDHIEISCDARNALCSWCQSEVEVELKQSQMALETQKQLLWGKVRTTAQNGENGRRRRGAVGGGVGHHVGDRQR